MNIETVPCNGTATVQEFPYMDVTPLDRLRKIYFLISVQQVCELRGL